MIIVLITGVTRTMCCNVLPICCNYRTSIDSLSFALTSYVIVLYQRPLKLRVNM